MKEQMGWKKIRTCSRVSSGVCRDCKKQTYHHARRNGDQALCRDCYEARFEPDKAHEREEAKNQRDLARSARLNLALKGKLPGAKITESGTVLGPLKDLAFGLRGREVLREGLYDTEAWNG